MEADPEDMAFVEWMVRLGKEDRELYRALREEAWAMVQGNHARQSEAQRAAWLRSSS